MGIALSPCTPPDGIWVQAVTGNTAGKLNLASPSPPPRALPPQLWFGRGTFIAPQTKVCWNSLLLHLLVNFCSRVSFHLVDLGFLSYPRPIPPTPAFIFNTYVVVERKYNTILGLAFQFHCIFFFNGTSRISAPGIIRLVSKMGSALWVLLFQMN